MYNPQENFWDNWCPTTSSTPTNNTNNTGANTGSFETATVSNTDNSYGGIVVDNFDSNNTSLGNFASGWSNNFASFDSSSSKTNTGYPANTGATNFANMSSAESSNTTSNSSTRSLTDDFGATSCDNSADFGHTVADSSANTTGAATNFANMSSAESSNTTSNSRTRSLTDDFGGTSCDSSADFGHTVADSSANSTGAATNFANMSSAESSSSTTSNSSTRSLADVFGATSCDSSADFGHTAAAADSSAEPGYDFQSLLNDPWMVAFRAQIQTRLKHLPEEQLPSCQAAMPVSTPVHDNIRRRTAQTSSNTFSVPPKLTFILNHFQNGGYWVFYGVSLGLGHKLFYKALQHGNIQHVLEVILKACLGQDLSGFNLRGHQFQQMTSIRYNQFDTFNFFSDVFLVTRRALSFFENFRSLLLFFENSKKILIISYNLIAFN
jgi:hypothetical protein